MLSVAFKAQPLHIKRTRVVRVMRLNFLATADFTWRWGHISSANRIGQTRSSNVLFAMNRTTLSLVLNYLGLSMRRIESQSFVLANLVSLFNVAPRRVALGAFLALPQKPVAHGRVLVELCDRLDRFALKTFFNRNAAESLSSTTTPRSPWPAGFAS